MKHARTAAAAALTLLAAAPAWAQEPAPASGPADYRWAIYTSCTVAFVAIAAYLVVTHGRAAKVSEDVSAVERRLDDLEKSSK